MKSSPLILGIDTALGVTSLALVRADKCFATRYEPGTHKQASLLTAWIEALLAEANISYSEIDGFACTTGPGGFTSIRVGLATARGLALASEKPVMGVSTLEVLAKGASGELSEATVYTCMLPAGRDAFFTQDFIKRGEEIEAAGDPKMQAGPLGNASAYFVGYDIFSTSYAPALCVQLQPARGNAEIAAKLAGRKQSGDAEQFPPVPLYVRPPDAKMPTPLLKT